MTTIATQQPRAVDGGTPVGIVYPADISFSGTHTHTGEIDASAAPVSAASLVVGGGITAEQLNFAADASAPLIWQPQQAGTGGADGFIMSIQAQQGQSGGGGTGGDGADLELRAGLAGPGGIATGELGRIIHAWGDTSYKWREYKWCSGEVAYTDVTSNPITVEMVDNEIHLIEGWMMSRDSAGGNQIQITKVIGGFERSGGSVSSAGTSSLHTGGIGPAITFTFAFTATGWKVNLTGAAGKTGDAVIFMKWQVGSVDGS